MTLAALLVVYPGGANLDPPRPRQSPARSVIEECPTVSVYCPNFYSVKDEPLVFKVTVSGADKDRKLAYEWAVSRGEIKTGQGTTSITVEVERNGTGVGATVRVKGLPDGCGGEAGNYITHY